MHSRGLTLVETLLGLMILSVIAVSLYGTFAAGLSVNQKVERYFNAQREAQLAFSQLTTDFNHIASYDFSGSWPEKKCFSADEVSLEFLMITEQGLSAVRYELVDDARTLYETTIGRTLKANENITLKTQAQNRQSQTLVRRVIDFSTYLKTGFDQAAAIVLSRSIAPGGFKVQFSLPSQAKTAGSQWQSGWNSPTLPVGVRVDLAIADTPEKPAQDFKAKFLIPVGGSPQS